MPRANPFQTAARCWGFALRCAAADGDTYHVVITDNPAAQRAVLRMDRARSQWSSMDGLALVSALKTLKTPKSDIVMA